MIPCCCRRPLSYSTCVARPGTTNPLIDTFDADNGLFGQPRNETADFKPLRFEDGRVYAEARSNTFPVLGGGTEDRWDYTSGFAHCIYLGERPDTAAWPLTGYVEFSVQFSPFNVPGAIPFLSSFGGNLTADLGPVRLDLQERTTAGALFNFTGGTFEFFEQGTAPDSVTSLRMRITRDDGLGEPSLLCEFWVNGVSQSTGEMKLVIPEPSFGTEDGIEIQVETNLNRSESSGVLNQDDFWMDNLAITRSW